MSTGSAAFISYSRKDGPFVLRLASDLKTAKANVWLDQIDIRAGQQWDREVEQALMRCTQMLVVLSPAAVDSNNVMDEIAFGLEEGKSIVPLIYQDCRVPFRLRRLHYVDFRADYAAGLKALLKALDIESVQSVSSPERSTMAQQEAAAREKVETARKVERERVEREGVEAARRVERERVERERAEAARKAERERVEQERVEAARKAEQQRVESQKPPNVSRPSEQVLAEWRARRKELRERRAKLRPFLLLLFSTAGVVAGIFVHLPKVFASFFPFSQSGLITLFITENNSVLAILVKAVILSILTWIYSRLAYAAADAIYYTPLLDKEVWIASLVNGIVLFALFILLCGETSAIGGLLFATSNSIFLAASLGESEWG